MTDTPERQSYPHSWREAERPGCGPNAAPVRIEDMQPHTSPLIPYEQQTARIAALAEALKAVNEAVASNLHSEAIDGLMERQQHLVAELTMACRTIIHVQGTPEVEAV